MEKILCQRVHQVRFRAAFALAAQARKSPSRQLHNEKGLTIWWGLS